MQEASPEGWQEFSPGWSASDTRGFSFNVNRTPEGCEDNVVVVEHQINLQKFGHTTASARNEELRISFDRAATPPRLRRGAAKTCESR